MIELPMTPAEVRRAIKRAKKPQRRTRALAKLFYVRVAELLDYAFPERIEQRRRQKQEAANRYKKKKLAEARAARLAQKQEAPD